MSEAIRVALHPLGRTMSVEAGSPLRAALFSLGVEFPCGGEGRCRGCRVRVVSGELPVTAADARRFGAAELAAGWRLACQAKAGADVTLELAQWEAVILADDSNFEFTPCAGLGVAVDVGTTTIAAQLVDRRNGQVLAVRTALNAQAAYGADVMSRIQQAVHGGRRKELVQALRRQIGTLVGQLVQSAAAATEPLAGVVLVGNTAMQHFFCDRDTASLAEHPFEPETLDGGEFSLAELGWDAPGVAGGVERTRSAWVKFLPGLGGFVGSDVLAGILATRLHESASPVLLLDLGTNGEIVVGHREGFLCASTAAGPAFEGARISCGMRAETGAVAEVRAMHGRLECTVLGEGASPRGICGSGLVDAVAGALELGWLRSDGRLREGAVLPLVGSVCLRQEDIRELQLAKAAIAAGIEVLLRQRGVAVEALEWLWLAGAFGNYLNPGRARRIGLFEVDPGRVRAVGNTALLGAKMCLFEPAGGESVCDRIRALARHVVLNDAERFMDAFVEAMAFPAEGRAAASGLRTVD